MLHESVVAVLEEVDDFLNIVGGKTDALTVRVLNSAPLRSTIKRLAMKPLEASFDFDKKGCRLPVWRASSDNAAVNNQETGELTVELIVHLRRREQHGVAL